MKAGNHGDTVSKHASLERRSIDAIGATRLPAKALHEFLSRHRFTPDLVEWISASHEISEAMLTRIACVDHLAGFTRRPSGSFEANQSLTDRTRPQNGHLHQKMGAGLGSDKSMPLGHGDCQPAKLLAVPEK